MPAQVSSRASQRQAVAQAVPRSDQGEGRLLREDARYRYYAVAGDGELGIFRRASKATGTSIYVVGQSQGEDRSGQSRTKWREFGTEAAARGEMARLASQ